IEPIVSRCKAPTEQAIKDAKLSKDDIHKIILVGGPTRMPIVRKFIEDFIGKKAERGVDPMECVAQGAAIQGGVLAGEVKDILLLDVTPLSLGIETLGGVFTKLIDRNTTIPAKKSQIFSTASDGQPAVTVRVGQGERPMFADNKLLGQFDLVGIPPAPRGVPQIEVSFDIDANGIMHVSAKDLGTSKQQSIKITAPNKLSESDIEKMKKEAEEHADEDLKRKEEVETKNIAEQTIYQTENTLSQFKDQVDPSIKEKIEKQLKELKEANKGTDIQKIKDKTEELNKVVQEIGAKLYQKVAEEEAKKKGKSGQANDPGADFSGSPTGHDEDNGSSGGNGDKVVDADYEIKDDDKKKKKK
ncbi:MAG: Hsp70 family protein, partial [Thaumarchaeota archaeon]|nr:Hsp70 family protein [Nitrososphaerota archaeon]